jgi:hypothetical protein
LEPEYREFRLAALLRFPGPRTLPGSAGPGALVWSSTPSREDAIVKIAIYASTVLILVAGVPLEIGTAQPAPPPDLQPARRALETWLEQNRLSEHLELAKLRLSPVPSPQVNDPDEKSLHLDLRFRAADNKTDDAIKQFTGFLNQYQAANGVSLPETVFYKLIHSRDWPRSDAVVTFIVVEDRFNVSLDPGSGELVFHQTQQRGTVRQVIDIPLLAGNKAAGANQVTLKSSSVSAIVLPQQIEKFLSNYFVETNRTAQLKDPDIKYEPQEPDYVGMKVKGVKSQVLPANNYWEKLQISFELKSAPEGQKVVCYLSAEYASGLFGKLPSDDDYSAIDEARLRDYTSNLLRKLQDHLSRSTP